MVKFSWNPSKARSNIEKHGISFETARLVWEDPFHRIIFDRVEAGEERWWAIGTIGPIQIVVVVHTYPEPDDDTHVRIIGARKATPGERKRHESEA